MSAWLVSNETISKIANTTMKDVKNAELFAKDLHKMNVNALMDRYHDDYTEMLSAFKYIPTVIFADKYQYHKSLSCFLYQCSEGNVPEMALFKKVEEVQRKLAYDIVTKTSEWDEAKWE